MSDEEEKNPTYYNSSDSPVLMDAYGRTLGGRERGEFPETPAVRRALEDGTLIEQKDEEDEEDDSGQEGGSPSNGEDTGSSTVKKQTAKKTRN